MIILLITLLIEKAQLSRSLNDGDSPMSLQKDKLDSDITENNTIRDIVSSKIGKPFFNISDSVSSDALRGSVNDSKISEMKDEEPGLRFQDPDSGLKKVADIDRFKGKEEFNEKESSKIDKYEVECKNTEFRLETSPKNLENTERCDCPIPEDLISEETLENNKKICSQGPSFAMHSYSQEIVVTESFTLVENTVDIHSDITIPQGSDEHILDDAPDAFDIRIPQGSGSHILDDAPETFDIHIPQGSDEHILDDAPEMYMTEPLKSQEPEKHKESKAIPKTDQLIAMPEQSSAESINLDLSQSEDLLSSKTNLLCSENVLESLEILESLLPGYINNHVCESTDKEILESTDIPTSSQKQDNASFEHDMVIPNEQTDILGGDLSADPQPTQMEHHIDASYLLQALNFITRQISFIYVNVVDTLKSYFKSFYSRNQNSTNIASTNSGVDKSDIPAEWSLNQETNYDTQSIQGSVYSDGGDIGMTDGKNVIPIFDPRSNFRYMALSSTNSQYSNDNSSDTYFDDLKRQYRRMKLLKKYQKTEEDYLRNKKNLEELREKEKLQQQVEEQENLLNKTKERINEIMKELKMPY